METSNKEMLRCLYLCRDNFEKKLSNRSIEHEANLNKCKLLSLYMQCIKNIDYIESKLETPI